MPWYEEAVVVVFWGVFFSILFYGPIYLIYLLIIQAFKRLIVITAVLIAISNVSISYNKDSCYSYLFTLILKYHSHRGIWSHYLPEDAPVIIVGPPHGVFPFGSLLACIAVPRTSGMTLDHD